MELQIFLIIDFMISEQPVSSRLGGFMKWFKKHRSCYLGEFGEQFQDSLTSANKHRKCFWTPNIFHLSVKVLIHTTGRMLMSKNAVKKVASLIDTSL